MLAGGTTYEMCVLRYLTPSGGLKASLDSMGIHAKTPFEQAATCAAANLLGCSVHLVLLHLSTRTPADGETECSNKDCSGASKDPGSAMALLDLQE